MKVVIVGGVAGGASCAARLRRLDEDAEIVMLERTGYVSYANCGLPYYVGEVITDSEDLTLQTPESFRRRFNVDVRVHSEALSIDRESKKVRVRDLGTGDEYDEPYDVLVLSPGARPVVPDVPGIHDPRVMVLRTVEDCLALKNAVAGKGSAVVCGGGYIGVETAENLVKARLKVTIIQRRDHVLPQLDREMAADVHGHLRRHGVELVLGIRDRRKADRDHRLGETHTRRHRGPRARCRSGDPPCGGLRAGARCQGRHKSRRPHENLRPIDLRRGGRRYRHRHGHREGDEHTPGGTGQQAGEDCGLQHRRARRRVQRDRWSLHSPRLRHVRRIRRAHRGQGEEGRDPVRKVYNYSASHAAYYPGGTNMSVKTLFDPSDGRVLGAQIVGYDGVDKRTDSMAIAIEHGMTVRDLADMELSYAPPYSSAKDPVNYVGFIACNVLDGLVKQCFIDEIDSKAKDPSCIVVDVRTPREYARSRIEGSVNIPIDDLRARISEIPKDKKVYLVCRSALRSYIAARILSQRGYDCWNMAGGYRLYESVKNDSESGDPTCPPCGQPRRRGDRHRLSTPSPFTGAW